MCCTRSVAPLFHLLQDLPNLIRERKGLELARAKTVRYIVMEPESSTSPINPLNIFQGPDAVAHYFDPDRNPLLPLVEIPDRLNPLRKHGVRIYAKVLTALPAQNVKSLPGMSRDMERPSSFCSLVISP